MLLEDFMNKTLLAATLALATLTACGDSAPPPSTQVLFKVQLGGKNEKPNPINTNAEGTLIVNLSEDKKLYVSGIVGDLNSTLTSASIRGPADTNTNADSIYDLSFLAVKGTNNQYLISGVFKNLSDTQIKQLRDKLWYINVYTEGNKSGEVRGQIE